MNPRPFLGALALSLAPGVAFGQTGSVLSDQEKPEVRARYAVEAGRRMACPPAPTPKERWQAFEKASTHKWDHGAMGCAVEHGAASLEDISLPTNLVWAWFTFRVSNIERHLEVLGGHLEYFDALHKLYGPHYAGIEMAIELGLRWQKTKASAEKILARIDPLMPKLPEARLLRAAFLLAATQREATALEQNAAVKKAMVDLEAVLKDKPEALDGLAQLLAGQVLVTLPEMLGGDALRGIELLEGALRLNPTDLSVHRALVEAYLGERENDKAVALLKEALAVDPALENPQDYVDDTRFLGGVADRLGQAELVQGFREARRARLAAQPELLPRRQTAAFGHGGENPLTGELADDLN